MNPCFPFITDSEEDPARQPIGASHFIIRKACQKDLTSLAEVLADSFHSQTGFGRWLYPLLRLGIYEDLRVRLRSVSPSNICLVAVAGASTQALEGALESECITGTVEMVLRTPTWQQPRSQYPYISNLAVLRSYRRRGVAQKLLSACERTAIDWGCRDIYLHVLESNYQARQLYFKAGYRLQDVDPKWSFCLPLRPRRLFLHKHLGSTSARSAIGC